MTSTVMDRHGVSMILCNRFGFLLRVFECRSGGRVIHGNHRWSDRADIASRPRAFVPLGKIANSFVRNQGLRADPR
jgi:hypothetical protein